MRSHHAGAAGGRACTPRGCRAQHRRLRAGAEGCGGVAGKLMSLQQAVAEVADGAALSLGGVLLSRVPAAFVREMVHQGKRDLTLIKPSPSYDLDMLAAAGALRAVRIGMTTFESRFGQSLNFRHAVERGEIAVQEHA